MMVICQSRSVKLMVEGRTLYFSSRKEAQDAKRFYVAWGFHVGKQVKH